MHGIARKVLKGYSWVLKVPVELASGSRGRTCATQQALLSSVGPTGVRLVSGVALCIGYSRRTQGVLMALAGSAPVSDVLHEARIGAGPAASGSAAHHGARWSVWDPSRCRTRGMGYSRVTPISASLHLFITSWVLRARRASLNLHVLLSWARPTGRAECCTTRSCGAPRRTLQYSTGTHSVIRARRAPARSRAHAAVPGARRLLSGRTMTLAP